MAQNFAHKPLDFRIFGAPPLLGGQIRGNGFLRKPLLLVLDRVATCQLLIGPCVMCDVKNAFKCDAKKNH